MAGYRRLGGIRRLSAVPIWRSLFTARGRLDAVVETARASAEVRGEDDLSERSRQIKLPW